MGLLEKVVEADNGGDYIIHKQVIDCIIKMVINLAYIRILF